MWLMFKFILDDGEEQFTYHFGLWIPSRVVYMPDEVGEQLNALNFSMTRSTWRKKHMCSMKCVFYKAS
jgi:hypothetical protein